MSDETNKQEIIKTDTNKGLNSYSQIESMLKRKKKRIKILPIKSTKKDFELEKIKIKFKKIFKEEYETKYSNIINFIIYSLVLLKKNNLKT